MNKNVVVNNTLGWHVTTSYNVEVYLLCTCMEKLITDNIKTSQNKLMNPHTCRNYNAH